jgi:two-component system osmolarity sensor histidine kinase EnvZ
MGISFSLKPFLPKGLLGRSLLIIVTPLILVQFVTAYFFYYRHWDTISKRFARTLAGDIAQIVELQQELPWPDMQISSAKNMNLRLRFLPHTRIYETPAAAAAAFPDFTHALHERGLTPFHMDLDYHPGDMVIRINLQEGALEIQTTRKRLYSHTAPLFLAWTVGTSLLLFVIATIFMRNQVRPVRRLAIAADAFGKGRSVPTFKPEGAREVRQASAAFIRMHDRIKRQMEQRTEMLAGVSHDLRTPLTRMKLQLTLMSSFMSDAEKEEMGISELECDILEMERMINDYLTFVRGEGTEQLTPTNIGKMLQDIVARARRSSSASLDMHCEETLIISARQNALDRCIGNLVNNACRYANHISIRVGKRSGAIEICIDDDGPGIPEAQRNKVFKAFYRIDVSRNPNTGGTGLGLTISRDVARSLGGDIKLDSSPMGGLRAMIILPL